MHQTKQKKEDFDDFGDFLFESKNKSRERERETKSYSDCLHFMWVRVSCATNANKTIQFSHLIRIKD